MNDFLLHVLFYDGIMKKYDIKPMFDSRPYINGKPAFNELRDNVDLYYKATVEEGGHAVIWNKRVDLGCNELYDNGDEIPSPFQGILSFSDACFLWNLNESTLRKAVQYGKLKPGSDCYKFGNQWVVTIDSMVREYGGAPELIEFY